MKTRTYKTATNQLARDVFVNDWPIWFFDITMQATFQGVHATYFSAGFVGGWCANIKQGMCERGSVNEIALNAGRDVGEAIAALEPEAVAQVQKHLRLRAAGETGKQGQITRKDMAEAAARLKAIRNDKLKEGNGV
jgi:hypothetical protein